jgi:hypothetical protein
VWISRVFSNHVQETTPSAPKGEIVIYIVLVVIFVVLLGAFLMMRGRRSA